MAVFLAEHERSFREVRNDYVRLGAKARHLLCEVHVEHRVHTAAVRHRGVDEHDRVFLFEIVYKIGHYVYLLD